jgi:hypothetical protein
LGETVGSGIVEVDSAAVPNSGTTRFGESAETAVVGGRVWSLVGGGDDDDDGGRVSVVIVVVVDSSVLVCKAVFGIMPSPRFILMVVNMDTKVFVSVDDSSTGKNCDSTLIGIAGIENDGALGTVPFETMVLFVRRYGMKRAMLSGLVFRYLLFPCVPAGRGVKPATVWDNCVEVGVTRPSRFEVFGDIWSTGNAAVDSIQVAMIAARKQEWFIIWWYRISIEHKPRGTSPTRRQIVQHRY